MFFTIPTNIPILGDLQISETMVVSWIVMAVIAVLCLWLTHDLKVTNISKRQAVAERRTTLCVAIRVAISLTT